MRESKEWGRIVPQKSRNGIITRTRTARTSTRLWIPSKHFTISDFANSPSLSTPSLSTTSSTASTKSSLFEDLADEARFRSLTDMKWGEFSFIGFGDGTVAPSKLEFDLTESAQCTGCETSYAHMGRFQLCWIQQERFVLECRSAIFRTH